MRRCTAAVVGLLALGACSSDPSTLEQAEDALAGLEAGHLTLELSATAEDSGDVGFRVEGPYSFAGDGELAILDLSVTELLGDDEESTRVVSTGDAAYVVIGGEVTEVDDPASFRLGDDEGFAELGVAGWAEDIEEEDRGEERVVRGRVNVSDFLADLSLLTAQLGGVDVDALDEDAAERLDGLAERSSIEVVVDPDDLPTTIEVEISFGSDVPEALVEAFGPYARATMRLSAEIERLDEPLTVERPT